MTDREGTFVWADLNLPDRPAGVSFYAALFGWEPEDNPAGDAGVFTVFHSGQTHVGGVGELRDSNREPRWLPYLAVADTDAAVGRAEDLGATVAEPSADVPEVSRVTVLADPTGARVGLWQPLGFEGSESFAEPGTVVWNELATRDPSRAAEFYTRFLGWRAEGVQAGGFDYTVYSLGDRQVAGALTMNEAFPSGLDPYWMPYVAVADADRTTEDALAAGGSALIEPRDLQSGRFAILRDPQGGIFGVLSPPAGEGTG